MTQVRSSTLGGRYQLVHRASDIPCGALWEGEDRDGTPLLILISAPGIENPEEKVGTALEQSARVQHGNVVPWIDGGITDEEQFWLVAPLLGDTRLSDHIEQAEGITPEVGALAVYQVVQGLQAGVLAGLNHHTIGEDFVRIVRMEDGNLDVKIYGFGLAGLLPPYRATRKDAPFIGFPNFMAPELAQGKTAAEAADIYAVGILAYTAIRGRPPFAPRTKSATSSTTLKRHIFEKPLGLHLRYGDLEHIRPYQTIVMKALEKKPESRYPSMEELLTHIEDLIERKMQLALGQQRAPSSTLLPDWSRTGEDEAATEDVDVDMSDESPQQPLIDEREDEASLDTADETEFAVGDTQEEPDPDAQAIESKRPGPRKRGRSSTATATMAGITPGLKEIASRGKAARPRRDIDVTRIEEEPLGKKNEGTTSESSVKKPKRSKATSKDMSDSEAAELPVTQLDQPALDDEDLKAAGRPKVSKRITSAHKRVAARAASRAKENLDKDEDIGAEVAKAPVRRERPKRSSTSQMLRDVLIKPVSRRMKAVRPGTRPSQRAAAARERDDTGEGWFVNRPEELDKSIIDDTKDPFDREAQRNYFWYFALLVVPALMFGFYYLVDSNSPSRRLASMSEGQVETSERRPTASEEQHRQREVEQKERRKVAREQRAAEQQRRQREAARAAIADLARSRPLPSEDEQAATDDETTDFDSLSQDTPETKRRGIETNKSKTPGQSEGNALAKNAQAADEKGTQDAEKDNSKRTDNSTSQEGAPVGEEKEEPSPSTAVEEDDSNQAIATPEPATNEPLEEENSDDSPPSQARPEAEPAEKKSKSKEKKQRRNRRTAGKKASSVAETTPTQPTSSPVSVKEKPSPGPKAQEAVKKPARQPAKTVTEKKPPKTTKKDPKTVEPKKKEPIDKKKEAQRLMTLGFKALKSGKYAQAVEHLSQAKKLDARNALIQRYLKHAKSKLAQ